MVGQEELEEVLEAELEAEKELVGTFHLNPDENE